MRRTAAEAMLILHTPESRRHRPANSGINVKEVPNNCMNNSNSSSNPTSSRVTLKLKAGAQRSARESKTPPLSQPHSKANAKPGAHWSDEYKERMQADMNTLASR
jgi:hypothetical protein